MESKEGLFYDIGSVIAIVYVFVILIIHFKIFPIFIDIYYHLAVMEGYNLAGGITTNAYWEFAPYGRPQLYPPLLHILMLFLLKCGLSLTFIARFTSFIMFPLTLLTTWFVARSVFNKRTAFFSVLILAGAISFFWHISVLSAAALAQILGLLSFVSVEKDLKFTSPLLITLMLYSHIAIPYFYFAAFLIYGIVRREKRRIIFSSLAVAVILYLPWLIHTVVNIRFITPRNPDISGFVFREVSGNLWLWIMGLGGAIFSLFKKGKYLFPLFLLIALLPITINYPVRFWEVHSVIPLALLSGIFIDSFVNLLKNNSVRKLALASFFIVLLITPKFTIGTGILNVSLNHSFELVSLFNYRMLVFRFPSINKKPPIVDKKSGRIFINGSRILSKNNIEFAQLLTKKLPEGSTIYTPDGVFGDFLFAFSGFPVSSGMLKEVKPYALPSQADDSYLVINGDVSSLIYPLNNTYKRCFAAYNKTVFRNTKPVEKVFPQKPVISNVVCFILLGVSAIIILYDFFKRRRE